MIRIRHIIVAGAQYYASKCIFDVEDYACELPAQAIFDATLRHGCWLLPEIKWSGKGEKRDLCFIYI